MIAVPRRAPAREKWAREDGLSLTELLVAAMLSVLVLALSAGIFAQTVRLTQASNTTQNSTRLASTAANALTQTIRMAVQLEVSGASPAPPVVAGTSSSLTIYSASDTSATAPAPSRYTYSVTAEGTLVETRCTGTASGTTWTFATCASTTTRSIGPGLASGTGVTPLFQYYSGSTLVDPGTGSLTDAQRASIDSITVTVTAGSSTNASQRVVVSSPVSMLNLFGG